MKKQLTTEKEKGEKNKRTTDRIFLKIYDSFWRRTRDLQGLLFKTIILLFVRRAGGHTLPKNAVRGAIRTTILTTNTKHVDVARARTSHYYRSRRGTTYLLTAFAASGMSHRRRCTTAPSPVHTHAHTHARAHTNMHAHRCIPTGTHWYTLATTRTRTHGLTTTLRSKTTMTTSRPDRIRQQMVRTVVVESRQIEHDHGSRWTNYSSDSSCNHAYNIAVAYRMVTCDRRQRNKLTERLGVWYTGFSRKTVTFWNNSHTIMYLHIIFIKNNVLLRIVLRLKIACHTINVCMMVSIYAYTLPFYYIL